MAFKWLAVFVVVIILLAVAAFVFILKPGIIIGQSNKTTFAVSTIPGGSVTTTVPVTTTIPYTGNSGIDFYVATNGNDQWSGTLPAPNANGTNGPFATMQRAQDAVRQLRQSDPSISAPIVVAIRNGTYYLNSTLDFGPSDSGTNNSWVVYEGYGNEKPVISGGKRITGWTYNSTSGYWQASVAGFGPFEQLWVNGVRHYRPVAPASGYFYIKGPVYSNSRTANCTIQMGSQWECFNAFYYDTGSGIGSYYNESSVEVADFESWTMSLLRIKSINTTSGIIYLTGTTEKASSAHGFLPGHRYLILNAKNDFNRTGEWYYDMPNQVVDYIAAPGENPNNETIIAPQLNYLIKGEDTNYIFFQNLTFSYSNWVAPSNGWPSSTGDSEGFSSGPLITTSAALNFTNSSYIVLYHSTISHTSAYALSFIGNRTYTYTARNPYDDQIVDSVITDTGDGGIRVGAFASPQDTNNSVAGYDLIQNNVINGMGRFLAAGVAIMIQNSHNDMVDHNRIYDTYTYAVNIGTTQIMFPTLEQDDNFEYNLVYDVGQGVTSDLGGIHLVVAHQSFASGPKVLDNVIHDVTQYPGNKNITGSTGYGGWGIYFDQGTQNALAEDNLVYNTSAQPLEQNWGYNNTVINNIFAYGNEGMIHREYDNNTLTLTLEHNIFYSSNNSAINSILAGRWSCVDVQTRAKVPCTSRFYFSDNLYWSLNGSPVFITTPGGMNNRNSFNPTGYYNLSQWQGFGEDEGSVVANPMFVNASADNFNLTPGSPAYGVGFVPFDYSKAGLENGSMPLPPAVPEAYPLSLLSKGTFG